MEIEIVHMNHNYSMGEEKKETNTTSLKSFNYLEDGSINFSILETKYTTKNLEEGVYKLTAEETRSGWQAILSLSNDKEKFDEDLGFYYEDKISTIYSKFFDQDIKRRINQLGYNHKLGILLYGKQGTGKTSMFKKYFNRSATNSKALVFDVKFCSNPEVWWNFLKDVRRIQNNPIIVFLDEFDDYFELKWTESFFKKILDGTDSIDNCLFMMTTNYIHKIPETIKDRPSRIKYSIEVEGMQDEKMITKFLQTSFDKIGMKVEFKDKVNGMKGWTIDELKQWVIDRVMNIESEEKKTNKIGYR